MKFYFPDSQDLVSPTYDFVNDEYSPLRVRQRDDRYAHEVLTAPAYDGILVSKAIVDGSINGAGKYTTAQRQRLYRMGVHRFFRLPENVETLGDCGAFNYVDEHVPPYTVDEVLDFYEQCGFDAGVSIDHIILGYQRPGTSDAPMDEWVERRQISLDYARSSSLPRDRGSRRCNRLEPHRVGTLPVTRTVFSSCKRWAIDGLRLVAWCHSRHLTSLIVWSRSATF